MADCVKFGDSPQVLYLYDMKIRIKDNSIRFRLTQGDVKEFKETGKVQATTAFLNNTFYYTLEKTTLPNLQATFQDNNIQINIPINIADNWTNTDNIGFTENILIKDNLYLKILVEKDLKCLEPRVGEDESDNYQRKGELL